MKKYALLILATWLMAPLTYADLSTGGPTDPCSTSDWGTDLLNADTSTHGNMWYDRTNYCYVPPGKSYVLFKALNGSCPSNDTQKCDMYPDSSCGESYGCYSDLCDTDKFSGPTDTYCTDGKWTGADDIHAKVFKSQ